MPAPSHADRRFLEFHGNKWRVVVSVPRSLQKKLGTKLKRTLETDSLSEANLVKWDIIPELRAIIAAAKLPAASGTADIAATRVRAMEQARKLSLQKNAAFSTEQRWAVEDAIEDRAEALAGDPVATDNHGEPVFDERREELAMEFLAVARGDRTPIDLHHEKYLSMASVKARTAADDERAIRYLKEWCTASRVPPYLQSITKKVAVRFCDEIQSVAGVLSSVTLNKYISRLSVYWAWLENRHEVDHNVWRGRRLREPFQISDERERPFTDREMTALLSGPAHQAMHDLMRIAALTGARLDAIVCLKVGDCHGGNFKFKPQKKEPGSRLCPIHPQLSEIVRRRTEGKDGSADVFPEWPGVKKASSLRERSFKTSNEFTDYRRSVGVDDRREGKRRGLVNFHSFRRWFITKAEQAGQPESTIASVVGHKRKGITLGVYSAGPLLEQARRCVEAVKLPELPTQCGG